MKFTVQKEVFDILPTVCIGVVVAKGVNNHGENATIRALLAQQSTVAQAAFAGKKVKEDPAITPYREAFSVLGINPNKYMCSIEALFTRIAKGAPMHSINPLVDLNNAVSLTHTLPMGTHDLGIAEQDIELRFARPGDHFTPFGADESETVPEGELVYAVGDDVRTRRWAWRQSEHGKITAETNFVFFPIDGFIGVNDDAVHTAAQHLARLLEEHFGCEVQTGFIKAGQPEMEIIL
ncbi:hypothetical protein LJB77_00565 [Ruminococcaceae bacterium OttesenSCG-928-N02]|nr:hypothetical protein [Ruminococcaceae bacterium OttesenSCG-928-N02]